MAEERLPRTGPITDDQATTLATAAIRAQRDRRVCIDKSCGRSGRHIAPSARSGSVRPRFSWTWPAGRLEASRVELVDAVAAAESALLTALGVAKTHHALVRESQQELIGVGLRLAEGDDDRATGADRSGVRIHGTWWAPLEPYEVLVWVVARLARAQFSRPPRTPVGKHGHRPASGRAPRRPAGTGPPASSPTPRARKHGRLSRPGGGSLPTDAA